MKINTIKRDKDYNKEETNKNAVDGKVIRNVAIARRLLTIGGDDVRIIDLKASRENPERTVHVFRNDEKFQEVFAKVLEEHKGRRETNASTTQMKQELDELRKEIAELKKAKEDKE